MNNKNKELSSLDKLKNILRRKADDGVKISVANAGWLLNLAYAAGQHKAVKDAKLDAEHDNREYEEVRKEIYQEYIPDRSINR